MVADDGIDKLAAILQIKFSLLKKENFDSDLNIEIISWYFMSSDVKYFTRLLEFCKFIAA